jgi:hypothetical protein
MEPIEIVNIDAFSALLDNFGPIRSQMRSKDTFKEVTIFERVSFHCDLPSRILILI